MKDNKIEKIKYQKKDKSFTFGNPRDWILGLITYSRLTFIPLFKLGIWLLSMTIIVTVITNPDKGLELFRYIFLLSFLTAKYFFIISTLVFILSGILYLLKVNDVNKKEIKK